MTKKLLTIAMVAVFILGTTTRCTEVTSKQRDETVASTKVDTVFITKSKAYIMREAHRGYSLGFPENTMLAFEEAIKTGTDRIELDVNITSDGVLIIMHDKTLDRTTDGEGVVTETSYAEIQKLDAGSWKSSEFKGLKIPTLKQVFELAKGKCMLNLDLKEERVAKPMVKLADEMGMIDQIVVTGKIPAAVNTIREINKGVTMFYELEKEDVLNGPIEAVQSIRNENLPGCLVNFEAVNDTFMKECKLHGIAVYTWGVLQEEDMNRLISLGVDGIMTDDLKLLNKVLNK